MAATIERTSFEEEQPPNEKENVTWKHEVQPKLLEQTKADECLLKNISHVLDSDSEGSEFSDISAYGDDGSVHTDSDIEDLCGELSRMPEDVTFPRQQTASTYEVEDWDKELEESECSPYDAGDLYCGSFQENNLWASYSFREDSLYNPCCHHAACLAFTLPVRVTEVGQFDDADE
ncbi:coordinator of PRMT5 and differentiation stimulator [Excalfactoria chinensis]|uniref:coordinator of PRMT5 and differentiation stimulator n=1 Tax=Excalfactoria chinensis TaxID=46218 RepID=UPI003B3A298A